MSFLITTGKLLGNPGPGGWAQVHEFVPEDREKKLVRGHLLAVVAFSQEDRSVGRESISRLQEEYFGNASGSAFSALGAAVRKVSSEFSSYGLEVAAAAILENVVYSVASRGGQVAVVRSKAQANVIISSKESPEVVSASGYPNTGDILILGTKNFFNKVSNPEITGALSEDDPAKAVEILAPKVSAQEASGDICAVFVKFSKISPPSRLISLKNFISRVIPERGLYIRGGDMPEVTEKRKLTLSIGVILLLLLVVSIGFGAKQVSERQRKERYETRLVRAEHDFEEAKSLSGLDEGRARELFSSSKKNLDSIIADGFSDPKISNLKLKIEENEGPILGEYRLSVGRFLDLSLLSTKFSGDAMVSSGETIFVLDKGGKKIISVDFTGKNGKVFAGPDELSDPDKIAAYEDNVFVMNNTGIESVQDKKSQLISKNWGNEAFVYAYAGNLYVLDKENGKIWRFQSKGLGFGQGQEWLAKGTEVSFSDAVSWTIDGSIYVIFKSKKILKFSQGSPQNFTASGVFPEFSSFEAIYTNDENKYIYILDKKGKRVVVLDKNGKFKAQYLSDKIAETRDIVSSEKEKKIILLVGNELLSIDMKHL